MRESDQFDTAYLRYVVAPLERSNGDILLSARTADGGQWLLFGDITGHGLPAAVAAPLISYIFYSHARTGRSAAATIAEINAMMCQQLPAELFMTACFVDIAADRKSFNAWNAAMPPMILFSGGEVRQRIEASRLMPFGISPMLDIEANRVCVTLDHPSRLYLHSDGASDVEDANGEAFGSYRLELFIAEMLKYDMTPADLLPHLAAFNGNQVFEDDIGLIEIGL
jgi:serine phosphatase RsbU (regulator of sigma subunit)